MMDSHVSFDVVGSDGVPMRVEGDVLFATERATLESGDSVKVEWKAPAGIKPMVVQWVLIRPTLTPFQEVEA